MPTLHEEHLDLTLVNGIAQYAGPYVTASGVVVDIDLHWVGSGRHFETWEIADIGVLVIFRRGPVLLRTKVVLLQSKRLYPRESEFVEDRGLSRAGGFGSLWEVPMLAAYGSRTFRFDEDCPTRRCTSETANGGPSKSTRLATAYPCTTCCTTPMTCR